MVAIKSLSKINRTVTHPSSLLAMVAIKSLSKINRLIAAYGCD
jgi:hypothetical protein